MAFVRVSIMATDIWYCRPARINVDRVATEGLTDLLLEHPSTLALGYQDMYKQKLYLPWSEKKSDRTFLAAGV